MSNTAFMINGFDPASIGSLSKHERDLVEKRQRLLGPSYKLFYQHPVHFVRGEGVRLYDPAGVDYLDVYNNVPSVGHCHPRVVEAIARQAATLNTHTRYLHEGIVDYTADLLSTLPPQFAHAMYTCTGSEAVDLALRIARFHTKGTGIIITSNAYHGITTAAAEISPSMGPHQPLGPHVRTIAPPDSYRMAEADIGKTFAEAVREAIADLERHGFTVAALIADSIFSTDGIFTEPRGFLTEAADAVRAAGAVYIADEVQPGFGRTGEAWWGFQRHGVTPDIVVMGKPMGNGMPIAGIALQPHLVEEFGAKIRYFNTFGANTVSIAAAQAVLNVIRDEKLMGNAEATGIYMIEGMRRLADRFERIGDVRGAGFYQAIEFVKDRKTKEPDGDYSLKVVNSLREKRVLISASSKFGHILKIRPQLPFARSDADIFLDRLTEVLEETH